MCTRLHIHISVYVYIYVVYLSVCMCIYILCVHVYENIGVSIHVYMCVSVSACTYVNACAYEYMHACVSTCVYILHSYVLLNGQQSFFCMKEAARQRGELTRKVQRSRLLPAHSSANNQVGLQFHEFYSRSVLSGSEVRARNSISNGTSLDLSL